MSLTAEERHSLYWLMRGDYARSERNTPRQTIKMGDHVFTPHFLNDFYQLKGICFIEQKRVRLEIN